MVEGAKLLGAVQRDAELGSLRASLRTCLTPRQPVDRHESWVLGACEPEFDENTEQNYPRACEGGE